MAKANRSTRSTDVSRLDLLDQLTQRTAALDAQAALASGAGFEAFNDLGDGLKRDYLGALASGISDVRALAEKLAQANG